jgi:hypothetical protein
LFDSEAADSLTYEEFTMSTEDRNLNDTCARLRQLMGEPLPANEADISAAYVTFIDYLRREREQAGGSGVLWGKAAVPDKLRGHLATLDNCVFGLAGVLSLIAAEINSQIADPGGALGGYQLGNLLTAALAMNDAAMQTFYEIARAYPNKDTL